MLHYGGLIHAKKKKNTCCFGKFSDQLITFEYFLYLHKKKKKKKIFHASAFAFQFVCVCFFICTFFCHVPVQFLAKMGCHAMRSFQQSCESVYCKGLAVSSSQYDFHLQATPFNAWELQVEKWTAFM